MNNSIIQLKMEHNWNS